MRRILLAIVIATAAACGSNNAVSRPLSRTTAPAVRAPTPIEVLQSYVDHFNEGDVSGAVAQFATDAHLITSLGGCNPCDGQLVIRDKLSRAAAAQTKLTLSDPHTVGEIVTVHTELRSPNLPPGVVRAVGTTTASVRDGKITRLDQEYDASDPQTAKLLGLVGTSASTPRRAHTHVA